MSSLYLNNGSALQQDDLETSAKIYLHHWWHFICKGSIISACSPCIVGLNSTLFSPEVLWNTKSFESFQGFLLYDHQIWHLNLPGLHQCHHLEILSYEMFISQGIYSSQVLAILLIYISAHTFFSILFILYYFLFQHILVTNS